MVAYALPMDASNGSPAFSAAQTRQAFSALMGVAPTGRPVGASSGVRPGTPKTTVSVSGTTWSVGAHSGVLDVQSSSLAGPYLYATNGADTGEIVAADATNPRTDIVYVHVDDNVQDGSGFLQCTISYLAGQPAASPSPPGTPARSLVLATISVPKAGAGNASVTWVAPEWNQVPALRVHKTATQSIPVDSDTTLIFGTIDYQRSITWDGTSTATIVAPGIYSLAAGQQWQAGTTGQWHSVTIKVNGSKVATGMGTFAANTAAADNDNAACSYYLNAGDTVTAVSRHNANTATSVDGSFGQGVWLSIARIGS